jgi:hypothetical protein
VARLPGQVARGRTDFTYLLMADLHGARLRAPGLADVPNARAGDRLYPRIARFAVVRRNRRGAVEGLAGGVGAGWALENDMAAWHPTDRKPPIVGPGDLEAQMVVVGIRPTDQDLPPTRQGVHTQADLLGVSL